MGGEKRKQIRLTHYDYSHPGAYFITICTAGREKLFWEADEKNCEPGGPPLRYHASSTNSKEP